MQECCFSIFLIYHINWNKMGSSDQNVQISSPRMFRCNAKCKANARISNCYSHKWGITCLEVNKGINFGEWSRVTSSLYKHKTRVFFLIWDNTREYCCSLLRRETQSRYNSDASNKMISWLGCTHKNLMNLMSLWRLH
jgi:hypothetical protein